MTDFRVEIDAVMVGNLVRKFPQKTERAIQHARDKLLKLIPDIQILKYTVSANPTALRYRRTLRLRRSSKTRTEGNKLPNIGGVWWADPGIAPYAIEVIGPVAMQKPIHRGRWLPEEQVAEEAARQAPDIYEETLKNEVDI